MILPFSQYFDKEKQKPTYFAEKIWKLGCFSKENYNLFMKLMSGCNKQAEFYWKEYLCMNNSELAYKHSIAIIGCNPKLHTIRKDEKNRWKAGNKIHAVYNNRQRNQYQFAPVFECKRAEKDSFQLIYKAGIPILTVDKKPDFQEVDKLVINDGFNNVNDFFAWFNTDFEGKIIHFTDLKY